jgi:hypothetical protein
MKKIIIILTILAAPWYLNAQSTAIGSGAELKIGVGASVTTGTITNAAADGLIIESTSAGSGSLIASGTPTATVQRYVASGKWNMVSPSTTGVTGQTFFDASGNDSWLTKFDESVGTGSTVGLGWIYITKLDSVFTHGTGFSYWPSANETVEFKGNLQSASLVVTLANSGATHGYNLIGNPFSASLHWGSGWSFTSTEQTIWIWDGSQYQSKAYATDAFDIPVGQGFFMKSTSATTVTLPADQRVHSTQTFLKNGQEKGSDFNYLSVIAQNNQYQDKAVVYFDEIGTDDFDNGYDATKMFGLAEAPQLYFVENDWNQSNDFLPSLTEGEERTVAMSYIAGAAGEQRLVADFTYFTGAEVTLEDLKTGNTQNLNKNSIYSFSGSKDDSPERFLLHFAWSPNGIGEDFEHSSNIQIYSYDKDVYIRSSEEAINQSGEVFVYDLMGRELAQQTIGRGELIKLNVNAQNNYVVVKVVKDGFAKTEKVFIK